MARGKASSSWVKVTGHMVVSRSGCCPGSEKMDHGTQNSEKKKKKKKKKKKVAHMVCKVRVDEKSSWQPDVFSSSQYFCI